MLSAIPTDLSVFKLPVGIGKRLDRLMRMFFWEGSGSEDSRGMALIAWNLVYGSRFQFWMNAWLNEDTLQENLHTYLLLRAIPGLQLESAGIAHGA